MRIAGSSIPRLIIALLILAAVVSGQTIRASRDPGRGGLFEPGDGAAPRGAAVGTAAISASRTSLPPPPGK